MSLTDLRAITPPARPPDAARITRFIQFDGLDIAYDDRVLEPRPWTVMQSAWAAELAPSVPDGPILELCSGAGHIGLAAAKRCGRTLVQIDTNPVACLFAAANARAAGLARRVDVQCASVDDVDFAGRTFPLVIADPPYLRTEEIVRYPSDPRLAVDGGADGLEIVRRCARTIARVLHPQGAALLQLRGESQAEELTPQLPSSLRIAEVRTDGPDRAVALLVRDDGGER